MNLSINGKPVEVKVSAVATLQDILVQLETLLPNRQIVTEIRLNSRPLDNDWTQHAGTTYILAEDRLEMTTEDATELGTRAFQQSREQLQQIIAHISKVADHFRMDDEAVANTHFVQAIDILQAYFSVLQEATLLKGGDFNAMMSGNRTVANIMDEISKKLSELIDIQKNRDWVLLADVLEYELVPLLKQLDALY